LLVHYAAISSVYWGSVGWFDYITTSLRWQGGGGGCNTSPKALCGFKASTCIANGFGVFDQPGTIATKKHDAGHRQDQAVSSLELRLSKIDDRLNRLTDAYLDRVN
jgi:hypothetical protein